ncbi:unnamed protein product [Staurois parvus]|uniref:Uncharacterized protein n=1 Tax=Staurois parvus TaxID=386267 RepID=A0ABN9GLZ0_9NEOB|nr:unnamed protein product [Staurois parvus]
MVANRLLTSACSVKVLLNPGPCLPQYTEHANAIILVNINC